MNNGGGYTIHMFVACFLDIIMLNMTKRQTRWKEGHVGEHGGLFLLGLFLLSHY
uniref:Uncharacterized protein n=1 Tax=Triticum urartu TaxID=4572 RepID=A0A8R7QRI8_TRIUA